MRYVYIGMTILLLLDIAAGIGIMPEAGICMLAGEIPAFFWGAYYATVSFENE